MSDEGLEEVVFILQKDNTVKKAVVKSGIQDVNYIEITRVKGRRWSGNRALYCCEQVSEGW